MGAPGGVDHAVTTAERLAPKHVVQDGRDLLAIVGMLVPQQQSGGGHHQARPVTAHVGNRVRPLPALAVEVEPEPADPLRVALPDDQVNRAELLGHHGRGHSGNPIRHSIGGRLLSARSGVTFPLIAYRLLLKVCRIKPGWRYRHPGCETTRQTRGRRHRVKSGETPERRCTLNACLDFSRSSVFASVANVKGALLQG
jgi:hypothetical protein